MQNQSNCTNILKLNPITYKSALGKRICSSTRLIGHTTVHITEGMIRSGHPVFWFKRELGYMIW